MAQRPGNACKRSGCRGVVRGGVCSVCGVLRAARLAEADDRRGTSAERGYDHRWTKVRLMVLRSRPLCEMCHAAGRVTPATDVHHIIARRNGGDDSDENLQALCHACHSRITAAGG